jgi:hypothetical protein
VFQIVENESDVRRILTQEVGGKIGGLWLPRLGVSPEVPFPKESDPGVFSPKMSHLGILIWILALGQNGLVQR